MLKKEEVRPLADKIVARLIELGFDAKVAHSGSISGHSSYITAAHPNGYFLKEARVSDHLCGWKGRDLNLIYTDADVSEYLAGAAEIAVRPDSPVVAAIKARAEAGRIKSLAKIAKDIIDGKTINEKTMERFNRLQSKPYRNR